MAKAPASLNRGQARIQVDLVDGASAITSAAGREPVKVLCPKSRGLAAWACTASFGGGLVAGDHLHIDVGVGDGARCWLGTQASTKVYKTQHAEPCTQTVAIQVGNDALLACLPDPVACFADAIFVQQQHITLQPQASLVLLDCCTSGRQAHGDHWQFRRFDSRWDITRNGVVLARDRLLLQGQPNPADASDASLNIIQQLAPSQLCGTIVVLGPIVQALPNIAQAHRTTEDLRLSVSPLAEGVLVRFVATCFEHVEAWCRSELHTIPALLGDDPWQRKF